MGWVEILAWWFNFAVLGMQSTSCQLDVWDWGGARAHTGKWKVSPLWQNKSWRAVFWSVDAVAPKTSSKWFSWPAELFQSGHNYSPSPQCGVQSCFTAQKRNCVEISSKVGTDISDIIKLKGGIHDSLQEQCALESSKEVQCWSVPQYQNTTTFFLLLHLADCWPIKPYFHTPFIVNTKLFVFFLNFATFLHSCSI